MTGESEENSEVQETKGEGDLPKGWRDPMLIHHLWEITYRHHVRLTGHNVYDEDRITPGSGNFCEECYNFSKMADIVNEED